MQQLTWAGIILAGGESRRMGRSKALLPVSSVPLIGMIMQPLCPHVDKIGIVVNERDATAIKRYVLDNKHRYDEYVNGDHIVADNAHVNEHESVHKELGCRIAASTPSIDVLVDDPTYRGAGPLAGIYTAMRTIHADRYMLWACDMPNINESYIRALQQCVQQHSDYDAWVPVEETKFQLLAGCYRRQADAIGAMLSVGKRKGMEMLQHFSTYAIQEEEWLKWSDRPKPFYNMNYPTEYENWLAKNSKHQSTTKYR